MNEINTNIEDYSINELIELLEINVKKIETIDELKNEIEKKINFYIDKYKNNELRYFFENVKKTLLQNLYTSGNSEKTLIQYENEYLPFRDNKNNTDKNDMFSSFNGAGNQVHRKTVTKLLNIDSRFRNNYYNTNSNDYIINMPIIYNVIDMKISDLELSTNSYVFNDTYHNNYFWIIITIPDYKKYIYIHLPEGNYSYNKIQETINNSINSNSYLNNLLEFMFDIDESDGIMNGSSKGIFKIKQGSTNSYSIQSIEINFDYAHMDNITESENVTNPQLTKRTNTIQNGMGWKLGFRKSKYIINTFTSGNKIYSEGLLDLTGPSYFYLIIDDFVNNVNNNFLSSSENIILHNPDNIIARISIKSLGFSVQVEKDLNIYSETRNYHGPKNIQKLRVRLIDEYHRLVPLNNSDFSFTLLMTTIYSKT